MSGSTDRALRYGTTRNRAEAILKNGPNPRYIEPGGLFPEPAFSAAPVEGPFPVGTPEDYARAKANLYTNEGGPVVVEVVVPPEIVELATDTGGEVRFYLPDGALKELIDAWPSLSKRMIVL